MLAPGFWINRTGQSRGYTNWTHSRFAQIYLSKNPYVIEGEYFLLPSQRIVAHNVHFCSQGVKRLIEKHKRQLLKLGVQTKVQVKGVPRYDWDNLLEPLWQLATSGELDRFPGIILRGGRMVQASLEEIIRDLSGCQISESRRRAQSLFKVNQEAKPEDR